MSTEQNISDIHIFWLLEKIKVQLEGIQEDYAELTKILETRIWDERDREDSRV